MENKQPLLSICIPTYNRASILENTLKTYVNDTDFDETVEIVISDNCSTDETHEVGIRYSQLYKNVKYYRNEVNVRDKNFYLVMGRATGKYVKLNNDTVTLKKGKLGKMKSCIQDADESTQLLFPKLAPFRNVSTTLKASTPTELIKYISFNSTWLSTYGMWKSDYDKICSDTDDYSCQLMQVEWLFRISQNKQYCLYFDDYYEVYETKNKGSYNFFGVFTDNYFKILREHLGHSFAYEFEKYRIFSKYLVPFIYNSFIGGGKFSYDYSGITKCYFRHYWYHLYVYFFLVFYTPVRYMRDKFANC